MTITSLVFEHVLYKELLRERGGNVKWLAGHEGLKLRVKPGPGKNLRTSTLTVMEREVVEVED